MLDMNLTDLRELLDRACEAQLATAAHDVIGRGILQKLRNVNKTDLQTSIAKSMTTVNNEEQIILYRAALFL